MNNNVSKYILALVILLLLASVVMDGMILARLPASGPAKAAGPNAATSAPPASGATSLPPATVDANNGAKDDGAAADNVSITGMNLSLAPGLSLSTAQQDVTAASGWLTQNGFTITQAGTASILFRGPVAKVNAAFDVTIHQYTVNGKTCYSGVPSSNVALTIPKALGASVTSIAMPNACAPLP